MNLAMLMGTAVKGQFPTKYRVQHLDGTEFMHNVFDTMQQFFVSIFPDPKKQRL